MTDRIALAIRPDIIARALWTVATLLLAGRVRLAQVVTLSGERTQVRVDVTGYPSERDELVTALDRPEPEDWSGEHAQHREWHGILMTMHLVVQETLPPSGTVRNQPEPPASDPAGVTDEQPEIVPAPSPVPSCPGAPAGFEAACGEEGPHGPHPLGDEPMPGPRGLDEQTAAEWLMANGPDLLAEQQMIEQPATERPARVRSITTRSVPVPVIRPATPGAEPPAELEYADRETWADPRTASAWRRYAVERCRTEFEGQRFPTIERARAALDAWPGRRMLTDAGVELLAAELVAEPRAERPSPRVFARWPWVRAQRAVTPGRHVEPAGARR